MEEKKLVVLKLKVLCGKNYYYPDNEMANHFLDITRGGAGRRKVLLDPDLASLEKMGFEIKILKPKVTYE